MKERKGKKRAQALFRLSSSWQLRRAATSSAPISLSARRSPNVSAACLEASASNLASRNGQDQHITHRTHNGITSLSLLPSSPSRSLPTSCPPPLPLSSRLLPSGLLPLPKEERAERRGLH